MTRARSYEDFLKKLATASGIETPSREDLARIDRTRANKGSNKESKHPHDPDARMAKMKDGRTHLAHQTEHAVDLDTGVVVGVTVQGADQGDTTTIKETLGEAAEQVETVLPDGDGIEEIVADTCACSFRKGYHSTERVGEMKEIGLRTSISEPKRGHRKGDGNTDARDAVYANRRRIRGNRGKQLLRRARRTTGTSGGPIGTARARGRRTHPALRDQSNIRKRILIHGCALHLGILMRVKVGGGTPRGLQGRVVALLVAFHRALSALLSGDAAIGAIRSVVTTIFTFMKNPFPYLVVTLQNATFTTGC